MTTNGIKSHICSMLIALAISSVVAAAGFVVFQEIMIVYAAAVAIVATLVVWGISVSIDAARSALEVRPGVCPTCGYDVQGLRRGAPCPECGSRAYLVRTRAQPARRISMLATIPFFLATPFIVRMAVLGTQAVPAGIRGAFLVVIVPLCVCLFLCGLWFASKRY